VAARDATPLFGPECGREWHHSLLDQVFEFLLEHGAGLTALERAKYSVHSFRIYLACSLYAAKCPPERIMAILRWKSKESLLIYARMNDTERSDWVVRGMAHVVDSTTAANLPRIGCDDLVGDLLAAVDGGGLGAAARAYDTRSDINGDGEDEM
jgi:hypothetical protein